MRLDGHSRRATRRNSFCNGVTFTQRPIRLYEQVRLRLVAVRPGWSGALRFGFTAHDPSLMSAQDIPKYACPDLVTRPGYWAKALPENLALRDTVLAYWADRHGRVFYSVNDGEPVLFHCGVAVGGPLWALIDVYGITDEVQLLGRCATQDGIPGRPPHTHSTGIPEGECGGHLNCLAFCGPPSAQMERLRFRKGQWLAGHARRVEHQGPKSGLLSRGVLLLQHLLFIPSFPLLLSLPSCQNAEPSYESLGLSL